MNDPRREAHRTQALASDPEVSAWVSASAGSGKTHVLVNRVIRLLLSGAKPERILCLTFTRAAAAEMARRLFEELSSWIGLADDPLIERIHRISGWVKFQGELKKARQLFARALETPGGLKIQTIHAFCERLLQRFPVEAGVAPGFSVLEEREARELLAAARGAVLAEAAASERGSETLGGVVAFAGEQGLDLLLQELLSKRSELKHLLADEDRRMAALDRLAAFLDLDPGVGHAALAHEAQAGIDRLAYGRAAEILVGKSQGRTIEAVLAVKEPEAAFALLKSLYIKKSDGKPKSDRTVAPAALARESSSLAEYMIAERNRIRELTDRERRVYVRDATAALLELSDAIIGRYEEMKRRLGRYDYDDLIGRTLSMFHETVTAQWVLYKLDGGLDHILIDEAQDTSPDQWRIVQYLADEFFAGEGQRGDVGRTLFAVGDRKQSIFSFQGADPDAFDRMRRHFREQVANARRRFADVPLKVSFRSTQDILDAVDAVFSSRVAGAGVVAPPGTAVVHEAVRSGHPGLIEIWPTVKREKQEKTSPWDPGPSDSGLGPRLRLAARIAATICGWLDRDEKLMSSGRPIRAGDILVLLRQRTTFMDALVRALKQRGIPVSGADRLELARHIAVEDLMALARFVLLPEDDLALCCLLKSPLLARDDGTPVDDDDLLAISAAGRGSRWAALQRAVASGAPYGQALQRLRRWMAEADFVPPFEFFSRVLNQDGGRRGLLQRLGPEAAEPIDAFMALALDYAADSAASLQGFLSLLESAGAEIKRDMDQGSDEVRVMTVHGAKGLEAPIVILPDTCDVPDGRNDPAILYAEDGRGGERVPVWRLKAEFQPECVGALREEARERAREEYNRLLYVAMTRARDRLYVCGAQGSDTLNPQCWYSLVADALKPRAEEVCDAKGKALCWRIEGRGKAEPPAEEPALELPATPVMPPEWALTAPPPETQAVRWFQPSRAAAPGEMAGEAPARFGAADAERYRRGNLTHRLLQVLPDLAPSGRQIAGRTHLTRTAQDLDEPLREAILAEVMAVLQDPAFSPLFAPGSLAEVPVAALIGSGLGLTGQIDRLAVTEGEILIADYKTNRPAPTAIESVPPAYIRQLAAYRVALAAIYPGKPIRCALVWTDGPRLMEIPASVLDAALNDPAA